MGWTWTYLKGHSQGTGDVFFTDCSQAVLTVGSIVILGSWWLHTGRRGIHSVHVCEETCDSVACSRSWSGDGTKEAERGSSMRREVDKIISFQHPAHHWCDSDFSVMRYGATSFNLTWTLSAGWARPSQGGKGHCHPHLLQLRIFQSTSLRHPKYITAFSSLQHQERES